MFNLQILTVSNTSVWSYNFTLTTDFYYWLQNFDLTKMLFLNVKILLGVRRNQNLTTEEKNAITRIVTHLHFKTKTEEVAASKST